MFYSIAESMSEYAQVVWIREYHKTRGMWSDNMSSVILRV